MNAQERFWEGDFGSDYTKRNRVEWKGRVPFWRQILEATQARSVLDVGCNSGWNMHAIREVDKTVWTVGIDVNRDAVGEARTAELDARVMQMKEVGSRLTGNFDLVCTSGVLIHVAPEDLHEAMYNIIAASKRWVLAVEYEAPQEEAVEYRGNTERLWKRPFGQLYERMGLELFAKSDAVGFDQCKAWLMVKP